MCLRIWTWIRIQHATGDIWDRHRRREKGTIRMEDVMCVRTRQEGAAW